MDNTETNWKFWIKLYKILALNKKYASRILLYVSRLNGRKNGYFEKNFANINLSKNLIACLFIEIAIAKTIFLSYYKYIQSC